MKVLRLLQINVGDFVSVKPADPIQPLFIARVTYMWEDKDNEKLFHAHWFKYVPLCLSLAVPVLLTLAGWRLFVVMWSLFV